MDTLSSIVGAYPLVMGILVLRIDYRGIMLH